MSLHWRRLAGDRLPRTRLGELLWGLGLLLAAFASPAALVGLGAWSGVASLDRSSRRLSNPSDEALWLTPLARDDHGSPHGVLLAMGGVQRSAFRVEAGAARLVWLETGDYPLEAMLVRAERGPVMRCPGDRFLWIPYDPELEPAAIDLATLLEQQACTPATEYEAAQATLSYGLWQSARHLLRCTWISAAALALAALLLSVAATRRRS